MGVLLAMLALLGVIVVLGACLALRINDINAMTKQLSRSNHENTDTRILTASGSRSVRKLTVEINECIQLRRSAQIEYKRVDRELKQAIANISHDLRTPLTSISGYLQLASDTSVPEEERLQYLEVIKRRTTFLEQLISSFYELARLESGEYGFKLTRVNLVPILQEVLVSFYHDFINSGIEPAIELGEKPIHVVADEAALRRIFSNLVQNILRYSQDRAVICCEYRSGKWITRFSNPAFGLSPEDVPHLFERFYTADNSRSSGGTGLGLSIVKQMVEQMGHHIRAEYRQNELSMIIEWKSHD